jgi:hypothetical protein
LLVYRNVFSYKDPLHVVFLCGNKYDHNDPLEKRMILKEFLETNIENCRVVVLEENFIFGRTNMKYLAYDDAFLNGLAQIEQLASLYANNIIIIHETISTAAELGMFAINPALSSKICLLTPDDISIEEQKTSGFIKLAFMNRNASDTQIGEQIIYYPDIKVNRASADKSYYNTYFHNNKIGEKLGGKIISFIEPGKTEKHIRFNKSLFRKPKSDPSTVDYYIDDETKTINVFIHVDTIKIQLLALFFIENYRTEFRRIKPIKDHVTFICDKYEEILSNTIAEAEGIDAKSYAKKFVLKDTETCKLRQAVGYFLYMLQAIGLIGLEQIEEAEASQRKIRISMEMDICQKQLNGLLYSKHTTEFGRLNI